MSKCFYTILSITLLFSGCNTHSSGEESGTFTHEFNNNNQSTSDTSVAINNDIEQEPLRLIGDKSTEVVISNCKTLFNDNLIASNWVTVTNSTTRAIKGIELIASNGHESFKYKINLSPHSSKRLKTNKFDCNSAITGIIFSNGEYEDVRSFEEQSGIDLRR